MAVLVAGISAATIFTCVRVQNQILESVTDYQVCQIAETEDEYNLVIADDEQIVPGEKWTVCNFIHRVPNRQSKRYTAGRLLYGKGSGNLVPTLLFVLGTIFCAWMFYSVKLKQPLYLLLQSADRISQSDLDFVWTIRLRMKWASSVGRWTTMRAALLKIIRRLGP